MTRISIGRISGTPFRSLLFGVAVIAAPLVATAGYLAAQGVPQGGVSQGVPPGGAAMGNELIEGLKASKGCLGVETAFTATRKSVIFAWFEDKAATMRCYESDVHQTFMMGMAEGAAAKAEAGGGEATANGAADYDPDHEPMAGVPDDVPVMCIATITPSQKPMVTGFPAPISQVSIELYTPLPGGIALNGRLAPAGFKVKGMVEQTLGDAATAAPPGGKGTPGSR